MERKSPSDSASAQQRPALGVIDAVSAGFGAILRRPWVLSVPIVLDMFLWLGPRASAPVLYQSFSPLVQDMVSSTSSTDTRLAVVEMGKLLENFFAQFNLFSWLSAGWLGVPIVNGGLDATAPLVTGSMPLGVTVNDFGAYLLLMVASGVAGLFLSGLYWTMLASCVRGQGVEVRQWVKVGYHMWLRLLLLALILFSLTLVSIFPLSMAMMVVGAFSVELASFIPALAMVAALWLMFYGIFTLHGLALYEVSLSRAVRLSIQVVRTNFAATLALVITALVIDLGIGLIWDGLPADSVLRLIAILGHAVTSTGVFLASLFFYQNRSLILFERFHWPVPGQETLLHHE